jgi:esterase/lipase
MTPIGIATVGKEIDSAFKHISEYAQCATREATKRQAIDAQLEITLVHLNAYASQKSNELQHFFAERKDRFSMIDKAIDVAMENQDHSMLKMFLDFHEKIYAHISSSPVLLKSESGPLVQPLYVGSDK